jgi:hypothetical protein
MITSTDLYKYLIRHIDFDIDANFVKEFYHIQKNKYKYKYNVDIEVISKWLNAKVENLIDTLKKNYIENEDYIVKSSNVTKKNI